jgi:hypothetical protein
MADAAPLPDFSSVIGAFAKRFKASEAARLAWSADHRNLCAEAREYGLVPKLLKQAVREHQLSPDDLDTLTQYRDAVSRSFSDTDLGKAARLAEPSMRGLPPRKTPEPEEEAELYEEEEEEEEKEGA